MTMIILNGTILDIKRSSLQLTVIPTQAHVWLEQHEKDVWCHTDTDSTAVQCEAIGLLPEQPPMDARLGSCSWTLVTFCHTTGVSTCWFLDESLHMLEILNSFIYWDLDERPQKKNDNISQILHWCSNQHTWKNCPDPLPSFDVAKQNSTNHLTYICAHHTHTHTHTHTEYTSSSDGWPGKFYGQVQTQYLNPCVMCKSLKQDNMEIFCSATTFLGLWEWFQSHLLRQYIKATNEQTNNFFSHMVLSPEEVTYTFAIPHHRNEVCSSLNPRLDSRK